jgi:hypothetical protein
MVLAEAERSISPTSDQAMGNRAATFLGLVGTITAAWVA